MIRVGGLVREFRSTHRPAGLRAALRSVVHREYRTVRALDGVSFDVPAGTVVGFLGPNGSGKTTTLKCIAGLLTPTSGTVDVLGHTPHRREPDFLRRLGFVMGQRWQLHVDLPVQDSFDLHRVIYALDRAAYARSRDELVELLDLGDLVGQLARKLSLGQRMRCEFAAALLHRPDVVLLDEPTLGLDFEAQGQIRDFVRAYVELTGAAVLLTSHYLADIEAMADDVLTISHGRITFAGPLSRLTSLAGDRKRVIARLARPLPGPEVAALVAGLGDLRECGPAELVVEVDRGRAGALVSVLEQRPEVIDVRLGDPPLEETLRELYEPSVEAAR